MRRGEREDGVRRRVREEDVAACAWAWSASLPQARPALGGHPCARGRGSAGGALGAGQPRARAATCSWASEPSRQGKRAWLRARQRRRTAQAEVRRAVRVGEAAVRAEWGAVSAPSRGQLLFALDRRLALVRLQRRDARTARARARRRPCRPGPSGRPDRLYGTRSRRSLDVLAAVAARHTTRCKVAVCVAWLPDSPPLGGRQLIREAWRRPERLAVGGRRTRLQGLPGGLVGPALAHALPRVRQRLPPVVGRPHQHRRQSVRVPRRTPVRRPTLPRLRQDCPTDCIRVHRDAIHLHVRSRRRRIHDDLPLAGDTERLCPTITAFLLPHCRRRPLRSQEPLYLGVHRY